MYKHFSRPKTKGSSFLAIFAFAALAYAGMTTLSSQKTENTDSRIFTEGVTIHMNHNAPPVAALEDVLIGNDFGDEQIPKVAQAERIALVSGTNSMQAIAEKIVNENSIIHKDEYKDVYEQPRNLTRLQSLPQVQEVQPQASAHVQNIDLKAVGVSREELLDALFMPMINHEPGAVQRGGQYRAPPVPAPAPQRITFAANTPTAATTLNSGEKMIAPKRSMASRDTTLLAAEMIQEPNFAPSSDPNRQISINGALEMSQGLAFTSPSDRIVVYREDKGQTLESGNVFTKEGRFDIGVGSRSGLLVAELRTQTGEVLGSGRATMDQSKILIRLTPTTQGLVGRVVAANSSEEFDGKALKSAKLSMDMVPHEFVSEAGGKFTDPNIVNQSTMILRTQKTGFLPGLSIASAGDDNLIPMYSKKMVNELLSLQNNSDKINNPEGSPGAEVDMKNLSIVWGRVTKNGEAIAGSQVEVISADQNLRPVYFNKMMIPDLSLTATSSNGYYAFVGINPGVQALQVSYQAVLSEPSVIPADANSISQLNIDVEKTKQADLIVFDAFHTGKNLPANILRLGQTSGSETDASGQAKIRYAEGTGLMVLDVDAGAEYEFTRLTLSRSKNTVYAPIVTQAWFENLRRQAGLDEIAYTGSIMGFIQSDLPYKAAFGEKLSDTTKIVYFNSRGEFIPGDVGQPGGGFVIFNAPEGLVTVSVLLQGSEKVLTQTSYVDRSVVSVFSHWFH